MVLPASSIPTSTADPRHVLGAGESVRLALNFSGWFLMCSDKYNPGNTLKANVPRLAGFLRALLGWLSTF